MTRHVVEDMDPEHFITMVTFTVDSAWGLYTSEFALEVLKRFRKLHHAGNQGTLFFMGYRSEAIAHHAAGTTVRAWFDLEDVVGHPPESIQSLIEAAADKYQAIGPVTVEIIPNEGESYVDMRTA